MRQWIFGPLVLGLLAFGLQGCTQLTIAWAPNTPQGPAAAPAIEASSAAEFDRQRSALAEALQDEVYGTLPTGAATRVVEHRSLGPETFDGIGRFDEFVVETAAEFGSELGPSSQFVMAVLSPVGDGPFPVIMTQTFCPRWSALPHPQGTRPDGAEIDPMPGIVRFVFGRYICTPPLEGLMEHGYALAVVSSTDVVPDRGKAGLAALERLDPSYAERDAPWGAIGAWGWVFSQMVSVLSEDARFDADALVAYGHSRYGKAALVAAAYDERIAAVISHQSGTGGASLSRRKAGESVKAITKSYPHWFTSRYAEFAGREEDMAVDQHHLLALIAPRPALLGNAHRDVWSDPNGAFKAAVAAKDVYALYGETEIVLDRLDRYRPEQPLAFWMRPGTHGVVEEDWPAFLSFLDAHFRDGASTDQEGAWSPRRPPKR